MGHQSHNEECEMFDPEFLNTPGDLQRKARAGRPQSERQVQINRDEGSSLRAIPLKSSEGREIKVGGKEEIRVHQANVPPFPRNHSNPSSTNLSARKKHNAVPP